ncbi:hypothetical protein E2320_019809 [Naja naja]|nr:hypothetical protein E2320_019809 [Naja naja]
MAGVGTKDPPWGQQGKLPPSPPWQAADQSSPFQEPEQSLGRSVEGLAHEDKLSVCSKLCYGIGGAPNQVASSATSFFLQIYLLDIAQIPPFQASLVQVLGRACGAAADPLAGFFINRSKTTRFGQLMPWLLGCTPFTIVSYILMWYLPPFISKRVLWYLSFYCLFQALSTVSLLLYQVPYSALTMFLSTNQADRDSATAYREFQSQLLILGGLCNLLLVFSASKEKCPETGPETQQGHSVGYRKKPLEPPHHFIYINLVAGQMTILKKVYMIAAGLIGGIYLVGILSLFFGVKEKVDPYTLMPDKKVPFFKGQKHAMKHQPYLIFTAAFLLILTAVQVSATLMIPSVITLVTIPNIFLAYFVAFVSGLSIAASFLLPWSAISLYVKEANRKSQQNLEDNRNNIQIERGICRLQIRMCTQSTHVVITLKILVGGIPSILILLGLSILLLYPINEKSQKEMKDAFENSRRNNLNTEKFGEESTSAGRPE